MSDTTVEHDMLAKLERIAPWTRCPCCDDYQCNIHEMHAHDCPCPPIEEWSTDPYSLQPEPTNEDARDLSAVPPSLRAHVFAPGQSGNPAGRPKGARASFESVVQNVLDEEIASADGTKVSSKRELVARVLVDECLKRNGPLIRELLLREWPVLTAHALVADVALRRGDARDELARRIARLFPRNDGPAPGGSVE